MGHTPKPWLRKIRDTLVAMRRVLLLILCLSGAWGQQYREPFRPQFHFSPQRNWTNDPNGLIFFDGEYHLFFQFNPFGDTWGHMSWGHAVSRDLLHWQELPVAIPEQNGIMIFTGSTVVDANHTSGFCAAGKPCLVAVYTGHSTPGGKQSQTQNLAYSNDRGRTFTKYSGNPVLDLHMSDFRDPDVFWWEAGRRWVMAVALPNDHKVLFYASPDLKHWDRAGEFGPAGATGGQWECPTLMEVPIEGASPAASRWVLKIGLNPGGLEGGSGEQYFVGTFDGARFVNDNPASVTLWTDYGKDCYCSLAFNNLPRGEAPVILGWMSNWQYADKTPTKPWRGQMTVPRQVALRRFREGLRLVQEPVAAFHSLRRNAFAWTGASAAAINAALREHATIGNSFELHASFTPGAKGETGWRVRGAGGTYTTIGFDAAKQQVFVDRTASGNTAFSPQFPALTASPITGLHGPLDLTILVDRSTIEVFAQHGEAAITNLIYPPEGPLSLEFFAPDGWAGKVAAERWDLASAWTAAGGLRGR